MRVIFIGCVAFSKYALKALLDKNAHIVGVFTVDETLQKGVSDFAAFDDLLEGKHIPIYKVSNVHAPEVVQQIKQLQPDLIYVIGWSWLVKKEILDIPTRGAVGLHPTLLPEGRGRAPIPWTILKGLRRSGVALFYLVEKADSGDLIKQNIFDVDPNESATTLYKKVCENTYKVVSETFPLLAAGKEERIKQDETKATVWTKRKPEDGKICWQDSTQSIDVLIRAVTHPYPGAFSYYNEEKVFIWAAKPIASLEEGLPGEVIDFKGENAVVKTADGALLLSSIQFEGPSKEIKMGDRFCA